MTESVNLELELETFHTYNGWTLQDMLQEKETKHTDVVNKEFYRDKL